MIVAVVAAVALAAAVVWEYRGEIFARDEPGAPIEHVAADGALLEFPVAAGWDEASILTTVAEIASL